MTVERGTIVRGKKILVVEQDGNLAAHLEGLLSRLGREVMGPVGRGEVALRLVEAETPALVLMGMELGGRWME